MNQILSRVADGTGAGLITSLAIQVQPGRGMVCLESWP